jgi:hypothetical protein
MNSYTTTPKQDNRQYHDAPIINAHYDPRIAAVLKRIQALRGDLGVKYIAALARCDEKIGHRNKHACTHHYLFDECMNMQGCPQAQDNSCLEQHHTHSGMGVENGHKTIKDSWSPHQRARFRTENE